MDEEIKKQDEEISLIDLFAVLWRRKIMIIIITLLGAIGAVIYCYISVKLPPEKSFLPNVYTCKALMLIDTKSSGSISSVLGNLGGLASMAGVNLSSTSSNSQLAVYLVGTNSMLDALVDEFDIINKYNIKKFPKLSSRGVFHKLKADVDTKSGVFTVSFTHINPVFARDVVNYCTIYLEKYFDKLGLDKNKIEKENLEINIANTFQEIQKLEEEIQRLERTFASGFSAGRLPAITLEMNQVSLELTTKRQVYTQLKVQYELLKVAMASEKPVFQILEMAEVPEKKSEPNRGKLCIIVTFAAGFFGIFLAFALSVITNIINDPDVMAKLRGKNEK